jgi:hypothetical protein
VAGAPLTARGGDPAGRCAVEMGLWCALDLDADPTLRWTTCHEAAAPDGCAWRGLAAGRRAELDLARTALHLGLDVAPTLGDDGRASREIATKVKVGILLVETLDG